MISALRHKLKDKSILTFFEKKIKVLGFDAVELVKTFPLMYHLLLLNRYWRSYSDFFFSGYGQTDRDTVLELIIWKHVGTQKIYIQKLKIKSKLSIATCIPGGRVCIIEFNWFQKSPNMTEKLKSRKRKEQKILGLPHLLLPKKWLERKYKDRKITFQGHIIKINLILARLRLYNITILYH